LSTFGVVYHRCFKSDVIIAFARAELRFSWPCFSLACSPASLRLAIAALITSFGFANFADPFQQFISAAVKLPFAFVVAGLNHLAIPL